MKAFLLAAMVVTFSFVMSVSLFGQAQTDEAEIIRSAFQTEKKAIVAANTDFTEAESQEFWPVIKRMEMKIEKQEERIRVK